MDPMGIVNNHPSYINQARLFVATILQTEVEDVVGRFSGPEVGS